MRRGYKRMFFAVLRQCFDVKTGFRIPVAFEVADLKNGRFILDIIAICSY